MHGIPFPAPRFAAGRVLRRAALSSLIGGGCAFIAAGRLGDLDPFEVARAVGAVTPLQWLFAILATAASFGAVGQYDALFHSWLDTSVSHRRASISGAAAIAVAQTLGFGLASGTLARWRLLPELTLRTVLTVTSYVSFTFMVALAVIACLAVSVAGAGADLPRPLAVVAVGAGVVVVAGTIVFADRFPVRLPPLRLLARLLVLAALDTALAALTLAALLPPGLLPDPATFFAAFLFALGAGLASGAPGGVGAFELCLITLLPMVPEPSLIAAIFAFRLVYYALPACAGLLVLASPGPTPEARPAPPGPRIVVARAEAGLARLPTHRFLPTKGDALIVAETSQTLVAIGDTAGGRSFGGSHLETISEAARQCHLWPALYKCGARSAAAARARGWSVIAVAREAWLDPRRFDLKVPARRQLRRKLRNAANAGISVARASTLPIAEMAGVADEWSMRSGGERGFSMGRFDADYLAGQRCYIARKDGQLAAFASFHTAPADWTLDLMRSADGAPDGTMHALITHAIGEAGQAGISRFSLAAMPLATPPRLLAPLARRREARGLVQFKTSFAPRTEPLFAAAPRPLILALAGADILARIRFPAPMRKTAKRKHKARQRSVSGNQSQNDKH